MSNQCNITPEQLARGVRIYWKHAWPVGSGICPVRPDWSDLTTAAVLQRFVNESERSVHACKRYVLRLGNHLYPHMKFAIEQCILGGDFYFMADCHDHAQAPSAFDTEAWKNLRSSNYAIKLAIEADWRASGLPTFMKVSADATGSFQKPKKIGKRVLVVDDEPANAALTGAMLRAQGFGIENANSGTDALKRANQHKPDLIVTDFEMPGMSGREVAEHIRANEETREIPILICTYADVTAADLAPADALLRRPFSQEALTRTVKRLLQGRN